MQSTRHLRSLRLAVHPIECRRVPHEQHRHMMISAGVPEPVAVSNAQAFELIGDGDAAWITDDVQTLTGNPPRSLHTFLTEHAKAFT